jgi:hypothetical protein
MIKCDGTMTSTKRKELFQGLGWLRIALAAKDLSFD